MEAFLTDRDSVGTVLRRTVYAEPALVPESPWMMNGAQVPVAPPAIGFKHTVAGDTLLFAPPAGAPVRWLVVQLHAGTSWETHIIDGSLRAFGLPKSVGPDAASRTRRRHGDRPHRQSERAGGIAPPLTAAFLLST